MDNRLILVAGSGRSGTSLLSGILKAIGGHVPKPEVTADDTNPQGFGESQWVVDFHTRLLQAAGVYTSDARPSAWAKTAEIGRDWDVQAELEAWVRREFRNSDHVVVKDPRLLWFIPLWKSAGEVVAAPCFVTTLRHPLEVITSKQTYYGGPWHPNSRVAGWLNTMLYTERATRGNRRALVRYDDLLSDWMQALVQVSDVLDLALIRRAKPSQMRAAAQLVDPSLRRARATWSSLGVDDRLVDFAEEVWGIFDRVATKGELDDDSTRLELDQHRERFVDLYSFAESVAQNSVSAAARDGRAGRGGGRLRTDASGSRVKALRKRWRRAKRKARRGLYRLASQNGGRSAELPESRDSIAAPTGDDEAARR